MKKLVLLFAVISSPVHAHSMSLTIKKYVPERVSSHDVVLMNTYKVPSCFDVFVDGKPHFNPKVCLNPGTKQYIKVFVDSPPNVKATTKVCTEQSDKTKNTQRFQLCTSIITYFPEKQLQSSAR